MGGRFGCRGTRRCKDDAAKEAEEGKWFGFSVRAVRAVRACECLCVWRRPFVPLLSQTDPCITPHTHTPDTYTAPFLCFSYTVFGPVTRDDITDVERVTREDASSLGIIPRALHDLFERIRHIERDGAEVEVRITYMQIYCDRIMDLLCEDNYTAQPHSNSGVNVSRMPKKKNTGSKPVNSGPSSSFAGGGQRPAAGDSLAVRENERGENYVEGLTEHPAASVEEVLQVRGGGAYYYHWYTVFNLQSIY